MPRTTCGPNTVVRPTGKRCHIEIAAANFGFFGLWSGSRWPAGSQYSQHIG